MEYTGLIRSWRIFLIIVLGCGQWVQAQLLPPRSLDFTRTGRDALVLSWLPPNSDQVYPLYDLAAWVPKTFFYTKAGDERLHDCIVSDGKFIYTSSVSFSEGMFMKFDLAGNYLETFTVPGIPKIWKMTYDGSFFYAVQYEKPGIYCLDMNKKQLISIIPTEMPLYHICYIPTLDAGKGGFEAGNPLQGYYLRKDGTYLSLGPAYANYVGCSATSYYNEKLYAFCQIAGSLKGIIEFDVKTTLPTGKSLDLGTLNGQIGIGPSQMADDLNFYEYPQGTMNALVSSYYSTTSETGTIVCFFEVGARPLPAGLQGYNVYKNNVKQNAALLKDSVYVYADKGLNEETDYVYHATAVYAGTESPASPALTVRLPASGQLPLVEDFSSGNFAFPNFWEINPNPASVVWKVVQTPASLSQLLPCLSYSYSYYRDYDQMFVSKPLKSSSSVVKLRYDVMCSTKTLNNERLNVEVGVDGIWQTVSFETSSNSAVWQTKESDISSFVQDKTFQLRFRASGTSGTTVYSWYLDNIRIWEPEYVRHGGNIRSIDVPVPTAALRLEKTDDDRIVYETISDASGNFLFPSVEKGIYSLTVSQNNTQLYSDPVYAVAEENTQVTLMLSGPRLQIDTAPVQATMGENKTKNIRLPLGNTGNVRLDWNADVRFETAGAENEIGFSDIEVSPYWEATHPFDFVTPRETFVVLHKNHYYTYTPDDRHYNPPSFVLKEYSLEGKLLHTHTVETVSCIIVNLVSDGNTLYIVTYPRPYDASEPGKLIPVDLEAGKTDESKAVVTDPDEISDMLYAAYNPVDDSFYVGGWHLLFHIDRTGKILKTFNITNLWTRHIALDTFSAGGPCLWLFCQDNIAGIGTVNDNAIIRQFSLKDGKTTNVTHPVTDIPDYDSSELSVWPTGFFGSTTLIPGYFALSGSLAFRGIQDLEASFFIYKMVPLKNWLSFSEKNGETDPGTSGELAFDLNSKHLANGEEYNARILIRSNTRGADVEIPIKLKVDNSADAQCYAPENLQASLMRNYDVQLTWSLPSGVPPVKAYQLYRNGKLLRDNLTSASCVDTIPGMGTQTYMVKAVYESGCESYDSDSVKIRVNNPAVLRPPELKASIVNQKNVLLKWEAPRYGTGFYDDFESYPAFAVKDIGDWKLVDGDKAWTYYDNSLSYLNEGSRMAFMVFNPEACSPPSAIVSCDGKKQFPACFGANIDKLANDDWLISPRLTFDRPFTFSFMAKTHSLQYGFEKINIGYSLTGNNPEDFIFINGTTPVNVADVWLKYEYTIPANAKYVAVNCVTMNGFLFLIDNIYIGHTEYYIPLSGYNIYRNNVRQNTDLLTDNRYAESDLENGTYIYKVEAVFENGMSSMVDSVLLINYSFEAKAPLQLEAARRENTVQLSWLPPSNVQQKDLRYDDGIPADAMGGLDEALYVGIRWNASDLDDYLGYSITGLKFHVAEPVLSLAPFLTENGTMVASGEVIPELGKYTVFRFEKPVVIRPGAEYIAGYVCLTEDAEYYPISHDAGPGTPGKGDLISANGSLWYSAYQLWGEEFNANWNIAMLVERNEESEFEGYNLYRNNTLVNGKPLFENTYSDADDGSRKEYYVSAVYKTKGEKNSNHVIVESLGIKDAGNALVKVYPNPAKERLFVQGEFDTLELLSLDGKKILKQAFTGETITEINIQSVLPGVYLLGVKKGGTTEYYKLTFDN